MPVLSKCQTNFKNPARFFFCCRYSTETVGEEEDGYQAEQEEEEPEQGGEDIPPEVVAAGAAGAGAAAVAAGGTAAAVAAKKSKDSKGKVTSRKRSKSPTQKPKAAPSKAKSGKQIESHSDSYDKNKRIDDRNANYKKKQSTKKIESHKVKYNAKSKTDTGTKGAKSSPSDLAKLKNADERVLLLATAKDGVKVQNEDKSKSDTKAKPKRTQSLDRASRPKERLSVQGKTDSRRSRSESIQRRSPSQTKKVAPTRKLSPVHSVSPAQAKTKTEKETYNGKSPAGTGVPPKEAKKINKEAATKPDPKKKFAPVPQPRVKPLRSESQDRNNVGSREKSPNKTVQKPAPKQTKAVPPKKPNENSKSKDTKAVSKPNTANPVRKVVPKNVQPKQNNTQSSSKPTAQSPKQSPKHEAKPVVANQTNKAQAKPSPDSSPKKVKPEKDQKAPGTNSNKLPFTTPVVITKTKPDGVSEPVKIGQENTQKSQKLEQDRSRDRQKRPSSGNKEKGPSDDPKNPYATAYIKETSSRYGLSPDRAQKGPNSSPKTPRKASPQDQSLSPHRADRKKFYTNLDRIEEVSRPHTAQERSRGGPNESFSDVDSEGTTSTRRHLTRTLPRVRSPRSTSHEIQELVRIFEQKVCGRVFHSYMYTRQKMFLLAFSFEFKKKMRRNFFCRVYFI